MFLDREFNSESVDMHIEGFAAHFRGKPRLTARGYRLVGRIEKSSKSPLQFFMGFLLGQRTSKNSIGKVLKKWLKVLPEIDLQVLPVTSFSDFFRSESAHSTQNFLLFLLDTKNRGVRILPEFSFLISSYYIMSSCRSFCDQRLPERENDESSRRNCSGHS